MFASLHFAAARHLPVAEQLPHGNGPDVGEAAPLEAVRLLTMGGEAVTLAELSTGAGKPMVLSFGSCS